MDFRALDAFSRILETGRVKASFKEDVVDDLAFLKAVVMDSPQQFVENGTLRNFESLGREVGSIISSFDLERVDQDMAGQLCKELTDPLTRLWCLTDEVRRSCYDGFKEPKPSVFPTVGQLSFVDHLAEYLEELVKAKADGLGALSPYILRFQQKLQFVSSHLMKIPESRKEQADVKHIMRRVTDLAYEVEHVIDSFLLGDIDIWYCLFWIRDILAEVKRQKRLVLIESGDIRSIVKAILASVPVLNVVPVFNNAEISVKLGRVFNKFAIVVNFSVRSWSLVSSYEERKRMVFHALLQNISHPTDVSSNPLLHNFRVSLEENYTASICQLDELENEIHKCLDNEKYFVILEDVGDLGIFNDIRRVLPNRRNGSTILLTTPSPELVVQCRYGSQEVSLNKMSEDHASTSQIHKPATNDDVVGFEEETKALRELLVSDEKKLIITSIVAMAGQGKTTLARKLYSDPAVICHFDICAWCCVSQAYEKRNLLLKLLGQFSKQSIADNHYDDGKLAELLYRSAKGQRFLIVLDDMWTIGAWNDVARCFQGDKCGSRIIFTTRQRQLASQFPSDCTVHLGPLSSEDSRTLLNRKLFQKGSYPDELLEVGRQIADNCKGLPLSIVLAAGLLAKMEKKKDQWEQIARTLTSRILDQEALAKWIIGLSYRHLPSHLKPCFLYFAIFLEHREVSVQKLIRLWIAEGLIRHTGDSKSFEDVANGYLVDLIGRSLVTVAQEKSIGTGVKYCCVHDLLREYCLTKAGEENFLQLKHGYDELFPSFDDDVDYGLHPIYSDCSKSATYYLRRICIYSKRNHFIMSQPSGPRRLRPSVRSLLIFPVRDLCPSDPYDISFISNDFKLLKILDLEDINIGDSFEVIVALIHLRYLAVQVSMNCIPPSIDDIWNLETFLVKGLKDKVIEVPDSIWNMAKLRHVHINEIASFNLEPHRLGKISMLDNLQTFSTPSIAYGDDMEKILKKLRGIRKLKCIFLDSWDDVGNCNKFPELQLLDQLVSLHVFYGGDGKSTSKFSFPAKLNKLTLSNFRMPWTEISQLVTLENLVVLKLRDNAFEGGLWDMEDMVFKNLKFLKLDTLNVVTWSASSNNFPSLEHLILHNCDQLQEIPKDIGDINTLLMIEVMWCGPSVIDSAKKIQVDQTEYGKEIKVNIIPGVLGSESPSSRE